MSWVGLLRELMMRQPGLVTPQELHEMIGGPLFKAFVLNGVIIHTGEGARSWKINIDKFDSWLAAEYLRTKNEDQ